MKEIFANLRVIELANVLAGPAVGMFFAELGAKVIKVENKTTGGDLTRQWKVPGEDSSAAISSYYASVNYGKEVRLLDLKTDIHRQEIYELVKSADIVLTNYRAGEGEKLGMTYAKFKELNPSIILGNISSYGENDPRSGFDLVLQAEAGFMSMNGTPGSGPLKMPVALIDILAAHHLKEGILLALIRRQGTGEGAHISVSLLDSAIASLANQASNYLMTGFIPGLSGSLHPNISPYGEILITRDEKQIVLAVGNDKQFIGLCMILNLSPLSVDERFRDNGSRIRNRQLLGALLGNAALERGSGELLQKFGEAGIPAGMITSLDELFNNPRALARVLEEVREGCRIRCVSTLAFEELQ